MKVFAMSSGSYSDYSIDALFTTRKLAEAAVTATKESYKGPFVEEFELYDHIPEIVTVYGVIQDLFDDGVAGRANEWEDSGREWEDAEKYAEGGSSRPRFRFIRASCYAGMGGRLEIEGRNHDHVMKAYHDRMREWNAGARW
jgi:hypothetical protein